jgi:predicted nucleic acid-binding protein
MSAADVFFDTNILLYLISSDGEKADRAERLLADGGHISVQVLNEFAAVARRKAGLAYDEIRDVLSTVRELTTLHALDAGTHDLALDIADKSGFHIYDSLILASSQRAGCGVLYSEDLSAGQSVGDVVVINPFSAP